MMSPGQQTSSPRKRWRWSGQRWLSPVVLVLLWELGARAGLIPPQILAAPTVILQTFWSMLVSGALLSNLLVSLMRAMAGLVLGVAIGTLLALVAGLSKLGENAIDALVQMLRTLPVIGLAPLFIVWFGIGEAPKIGLIALSVMFPIYLNLFNGIRGIDVRLIEAARSFGVRDWALIRHVIIPGAMPSFLVGLRFALGISWLVLVVAEEINASAGLGYLIMDARDFLRTDVIVVCLVIYALLGLAADMIVRAIEARVLAWRPRFLAA
jgi:sulfonate transport system permease protein